MGRWAGLTCASMAQEVRRMLLEHPSAFHHSGRDVRATEGEKAVKILDHLGRIADRGYEMKSDPYHAELIIEHMLGKDIEAHRRVAGATTPGTDAETRGIDQGVELGRQEAKEFWGIVACCLSQVWTGLSSNTR